MIARIAIWSIADSFADLGELREQLRENWLPALAATPGLELAVVVSDGLGDRWGIVSVWESEPGELPGLDTIGKLPAVDDEFVVEAVGAGDFVDGRLGGRGRLAGGEELLRLYLWRLDETARATLPELRLYVEEEELDAYADVEGLRYTAWLSDEVTGWPRYGAFCLWETPAAAQGPEPSRSPQLIGRGPDIVEEFDVEATVVGLDE